MQRVKQDTGLQITIARLGMVYGPRSPGWSVRMFNLVRAGRAPLIGGNESTSYPVYVDNVLDGLLLCATHPAAVGETFFFVDDPTTWAEYLGGFQAMLDKPPRLRR